MTTLYGSVVHGATAREHVTATSPIALRQGLALRLLVSTY